MKIALVGKATSRIHSKRVKMGKRVFVSQLGERVDDLDVHRVF
jgi:hypothetical protein